MPDWSSYAFISHSPRIALHAVKCFHRKHLMLHMQGGNTHSHPRIDKNNLSRSKGLLCNVHLGCIREGLDNLQVGLHELHELWAVILSLSFICSAWDCNRIMRIACAPLHETSCALLHVFTHPVRGMHVVPAHIHTVAPSCSYASR